MKLFNVIILCVITFMVFFTITKAVISADTNTTVSGTVVTDKSVPTASAPSVVVNNSDVCKSAYSAGVQSPVLGLASGVTVADENCERIKLSRSLYGMGMKVAAISTLCQDHRVFDAMMMAGTPCPYEGKIGDDAKKEWELNTHKIPQKSKYFKKKLKTSYKSDKTIVKTYNIERPKPVMNGRGN